jgi:hypothetical protein
MGVNPSDAHSEQAVLVKKAKDFMMIRRDRRRQPFKVSEDLGPGSQIAASDLAKDKRMHQYLAVQKRFA